MAVSVANTMGTKGISPAFRMAFPGHSRLAQMAGEVHPQDRRFDFGAISVHAARTRMASQGLRSIATYDA
jgi:hypothetical protein